VNVYVYMGDLYCENCGEILTSEGPYPDGGGPADCPRHCAAGSNCLNAIELSDGQKIGAWLENELTASGVEYVREALKEGGEVAKLWAEWYWDCDLWGCDSQLGE